MTVIKMPKTDSAEWRARVELAATFRIANRLGWNEGIANHFSVEIAPDRYLLNPYELHFREITASNLLVVDGSFFPSSAAVNPGLTIVAQALRVAGHLRETHFT